MGDEGEDDAVDEVGGVGGASGGLFCPSCQTTVEPLREVAGTYCSRCGRVLEESSIVNEVTFAETSGGGHMVVGTYVGQSGIRRYRGSQGVTTLSREQTLENGAMFRAVII